MKKNLLFICMFVWIQVAVYAQYVTIPDPNFRAWLVQTYPNSMNASQQLDTTSVDTVYQVVVSNLNIGSLDGLQYFHNLSWLYCDHNQLTSLPNSIRPTMFYCDHNQLTSLPPLSPNLQALMCDYNNLTSLPAIPNSITDLGCSHNFLTSIPPLPYMFSMTIGDNPLSCFPLTGGCMIVDLPNTYITCLPANVQQSSPVLPVCPGNINNSCQTVIISGKAYIDNNANANYDAGDFPVMLKSVKAVNGTGNVIYAMTDSLGDYNIYVPENNTYTVSVDSFNAYFSIAPLSHSIPSLAAGAQSAHNDFRFTPNGTHHCLKNYFTATPAHRPGFDIDYNLYYANEGTSNQGALLTFTKDPNLTVLSASLNPTAINGNTYSWNVPLLHPLEAKHIKLVLHVPATLPIGTNVTANAHISSTNNEETPPNNDQTSLFPVIGSFDPNDKQVSKTELNTVELAQGMELHYLIRFQNTGNAEAINILVSDTLSQNVDISSLEIIGSSHPMSASLNEQGTLLFYFPNILLPDSNANEPASHGFITYSIKAKKSLQEGDSIHNTANIYFDYNAPVVTNTATTVISQFNSIEGLQMTTVKAYPNPVKDMLQVEWDRESIIHQYEMTDAQGKLVASGKIINGTNKVMIPFRNMSAGVYTIALMKDGLRLGSLQVIK